MKKKEKITQEVVKDDNGDERVLFTMDIQETDSWISNLNLLNVITPFIDKKDTYDAGLLNKEEIVSQIFDFTLENLNKIIKRTEGAISNRNKGFIPVDNEIIENKEDVLDNGEKKLKLKEAAKMFNINNEEYRTFFDSIFNTKEKLNKLFDTIVESKNIYMILSLIDYLYSSDEVIKLFETDELLNKVDSVEYIKSFKPKTLKEIKILLENSEIDNSNFNISDFFLNSFVNLLDKDVVDSLVEYDIINFNSISKYTKKLNVNDSNIKNIDDNSKNIIFNVLESFIKIKCNVKSNRLLIIRFLSNMSYKNSCNNLIKDIFLLVNNYIIENEDKENIINLKADWLEESLNKQVEEF